MKVWMFAVAAFAAFATDAAPRTGPWTKEQAWEWYNAQPWIRGCNYMSASSPNRYDMWQVWDCERRFEEMERELALAESIGFNAVRVIIAEDNGFAVWCEDHDGYMRNLERFLALCGKHKIRAIMCLGNEIADNGIGSIFMPNDRKRDRTRINWARALQPSGKKRLAHIRTLAKLRHENPVFADGTQEWVKGGESQGGSPLCDASETRPCSWRRT